MFGTFGLVQWNREGRIVDSLGPPPATIQPQTLVASANGGTSFYALPFSPSNLWVWSPHGYFVSAETNRYAVTLSPPSGETRRIEREIPVTPVSAEERSDSEEQVTASLRMTDPGWRWSGPSIPDAKPFIRGLLTGEDGRIWVSVAQPGERVPESELPPPPSVQVGAVNPRQRPVPKWRDPVVYDVFEPDGRYLGRVAAPSKTTFKAMRGDNVWAVARDSLDVQQVVRFRIVPGLTQTRTDGER